MSEDLLRIWTVYDHPTDYPNNYVARLHVADADGSRPTETLMICPDLDLLRGQLLEMGLTCLTRSPEDDAVIVEVWL